MAKMGSRKHLKRLKAPKHWPIHPKEEKWTVKPSAGSHAIEDSLPLLIIVRDILKLADNAREAKRIINNGDIEVDGRANKDYKFPVGFMDVLHIPKNDETYRVLTDKKGRLVLHSISKENLDFKLCEVINKTTIKGGKTQLNLHDGRSLITEEQVSAGDVVKIKIPEQEILEVIPFELGTTVLVTSGKHTGEIGKLAEIIINKSTVKNTVVIENDTKTSFITLKEYAFAIGKDESVITLPEELL